jgi:hypothetical protein
MEDKEKDGGSCMDLSPDEKHIVASNPFGLKNSNLCDFI